MHVFAVMENYVTCYNVTSIQDIFVSS